MRKKFIAVFLFVLLLPTFVFAHPGRTDSSGCHTCRTNCVKWGLSSGEYHCHRAKTVTPQPKEPIKSHYSETGGYTTPAPEYKQPKQTIEKTKTIPNNNDSDKKTIVPKENRENWFIKLLKSLF